METSKRLADADGMENSISSATKSQFILHRKEVKRVTLRIFIAMLEALSDNSGIKGKHASFGRSFTHRYSVIPTETEANEQTFWRADKRNGMKLFSSCVCACFVHRVGDSESDSDSQH